VLSRGFGIARSVSKSGAIVSVTAGGIALLGWLLNIQVLKTILPGLPSMVPNTAVGLVLAGTSLALQITKFPRRRSLARTALILPWL
jgi:hypothetical protein